MTDYARLIEPTTLRIERVLPGPIERIWSYIVESDKRAEWLAGGEMELRPGGRLEFVFNNNTLTTPEDAPPEKYAKHAGEMRYQGGVIEVDAPHLLVIDWPDETGVSRVRFELARQGDDVRLTLTHSRISDRDQLLGAAGGWHVHLDILEAKLAGTAVPPFWATHTRLEAEYAERFSGD